MRFVLIVCLILSVIEQAISGSELFPSDDLFDEVDLNGFLDDNDGSSLVNSFPSSVLDDITFLANNPESCGSSALAMIKARADACDDPSESFIWKPEVVTVETQEAVEEYWCSQNKAQDRGKYPVCAFSFEHSDVELQLDGSLRRSFCS